MKNEDKALNALADCIYKAIDKKIEKLFCDREAVILSVDGDLCTVLINNCKYIVKNGTGIIFKSGDHCLVHFINGNQQRKLIVAKL